jgi:hypothetical protein
MTALAFTDSPVIENGALAGVNAAASTNPKLLWIGQASGLVVATVKPPDIVNDPISTYTLFRAPTALGPWTSIAACSPSPLSRWQNLFDSTPLYGQRAYYCATVDGPLQSNALYFVANLSPPIIAVAGTLSAGAFGPYPLLGSDVFLNPVTGEGVIGPNGDLLTVNGLECLAQDLRTRITTMQGELLLHQDFGLTRERLIGSGQSNAAAQAQFLQARFIDCFLADPRVLSIQSLIISQAAWDTWVITVSLIAIGVEDVAQLNLVFPYFLN